MAGCSPKRQIKACYRCLSSNIRIKNKTHHWFRPQKETGWCSKTFTKNKIGKHLSKPCLPSYKHRCAFLHFYFPTRKKCGPTEMPQQPESARSFTIRMTYRRIQSSQIFAGSKMFTCSLQVLQNMAVQKWAMTATYLLNLPGTLRLTIQSYNQSRYVLCHPFKT